MDCNDSIVDGLYSKDGITVINSLSCQLWLGMHLVNTKIQMQIGALFATNDGVNFDIHFELNHISKTPPSPKYKDLIDEIHTAGGLVKKIGIRLSWRWS